MEDMNSFFNKEPEPKPEPQQRNQMILFKDDWKRVKYYRDRLEKRAASLPLGKRKLEMEGLVASISYMLSKFEVIDTEKFLKTSLEQRIA